jgi:hypothetical protein
MKTKSVISNEEQVSRIRIELICNIQGPAHPSNTRGSRDDLQPKEYIVEKTIWWKRQSARTTLV